MRIVKRLFWRALLGALIFLVIIFIGYIGMYLDLEYQAYKHDMPNFYRTVNSFPGVKGITSWLGFEKKADKVIHWEKYEIKKNRKFWKEVDKAY